MKKIIGLTLIILFSLTTLKGFALINYDRVIAVVNGKAITESEVENEIKIKNKKSRKYFLKKSKVLDQFIERKIIDQVAEEQSIIVTNLKVVNQLKPMMIGFLANKIKDKKKLKASIEKISQFILDRANSKKTKVKLSKKEKQQYKNFLKFIQKKQKQNFSHFFNSFKYNLKRQQLISIAIGGTPPSTKDAKKWYIKNKKKLGFEVRVKHILIRPKNHSFAAERAANKKITKIYKRIKRGESFEKLARLYSQDPSSAKKGGDIGWTMLAKLDRFFAANVYRMRKVGQISNVFKSRFGYHIVKFMGKKDVSFKKVKNNIVYKLYNDKMMSRYKKWIVQMRNKSDIKIFMKKYIKRKVK